jgi:peptide alpha-N-acetyltransferase
MALPADSHPQHLSNSMRGAPAPPSAASQSRGEVVSTLDVGAGGAVTLSTFRDESQLAALMALIARDLSEPYSPFTYRHFVGGWPGYTLLAHDAAGALVGAVVCKAEARARTARVRGYVAMLAVDAPLRRAGLGRELVARVLLRLAPDCDELVLEAETTNAAALRLYESLGFMRDKRLERYYLNGHAAWRLKCIITPPPPPGA